MNLMTYEKIDNYGLLTISRPEALNALNTEVLKELETFLNKIQETKDIRALIITGAGEKAFVAGADIKEIDTLDTITATKFSHFGQEVFTKLETLFCPVIAAVNGFALGGGLELALACDFIIASKNSKLGLPECTLGLIPGFGGTVRLARRVGPALAKQWTCTGEMIPADRAYQANLINQLSEPGQVLDDAKKLAVVLGQRSPQALNLIKTAINETYGLNVQAALEKERDLFAGLFGSHDQKEGTRAFIEKRKAVFKNLND